MRPYLEKTQHKAKDWWIAQGVGPEFNLQYHHQKKKRLCRKKNQMTLITTLISLKVSILFRVTADLAHGVLSYCFTLLFFSSHFGLCAVPENTRLTQPQAFHATAAFTCIK
jgi:hypothetical protein